MAASIKASFLLILSILIGLFVNLYTDLLIRDGFWSSIKSYIFLGLIFLVLLNIVLIFKIKSDVESAEAAVEAFRNDPEMQKCAKVQIRELLKSSKSIDEVVSVAFKSGAILKNRKPK